MNQARRGVVDDAILGDAILQQADVSEQSPFEILDCEPLLSAYISHELHSVIGKLVLAGGSPDLLRLADIELRRITGTAVRAMRGGFRALMTDFLPTGDQIGWPGGEPGTNGPFEDDTVLGEPDPDDPPF